MLGHQQVHAKKKRKNKYLNRLVVSFKAQIHQQETIKTNSRDNLLYEIQLNRVSKIARIELGLRTSK